MQAPEKGTDVDDFQASSAGFLLKPFSRDHPDPCLRPLDLSPQFSLNQVEKRPPVKRKDDPLRGDRGEFLQDKLTIFLAVQMMEEPHGE